MKRINKLATSAILAATCIWASACGRTSPSASAPSEAPNYQSRVSRLGLNGPFQWDDVKGPEKYELSFTPWTDTYWPTFQRGLARRFTEASPKEAEIFNYHNFLAKLFDTTASGDVAAIAALSPAEKHDLLVNSDLASVGGSGKDKILEEAKKIQETLASALKDLGTTDDEKTRTAKIDAVKRASTAIKSLAVSSEFMKSMPTTSNAWYNWARTASAPGNRVHGRDLSIGGTSLVDEKARDWSWEGICHGWAPAAIYAKEPKHAVMAKRANGTQVLFYEGDIRGLLSKAWADQSPWRDQSFIGGRCEASERDLQTDQFGRSFDARVTCKGDKCGIWAERAVHFDKEFVFGPHEVIRAITWNVANSNPGYIVKIKSSPISNKVERTLAFDDFSALERWEETRDESEAKLVTLEMENICRDVNPMTFHLLLTKVMTQGHGFVMDRTRTQQVWNQPVKGYELKYERIPGSQVPAGEPTPVEQVNDLHWRFRAPGTKFLVNTTTVVKWVTENGPRISYTSDGSDTDDASLYDLTLRYTLELNAKREVIGGEWGHVPVPGQDPDVDSRRGQSPDFVYYFKPNSEPTNANRDDDAPPTVDYDNVVKKVHACSLSEGPLETFTRPSGEVVHYSVCPID